MGALEMVLGLMSARNLPPDRQLSYALTGGMINNPMVSVIATSTLAQQEAATRAAFAPPAAAPAPGTRDGPGPAREALRAFAISQPGDGAGSLIVHFAVLVRGGVGPYSYAWTLGEPGATSDQQTPTYTYSK